MFLAMLKWLKRLLFGSRLEDVLEETKKVRIKGIRFVIKKIQVINYVDGSKSMIKIWDTYQTKGVNSIDDASFKKMKEHLTDVFMGAVVSPKLTRKQNDAGAIFVEKLFYDWDLAIELHNSILDFTYGKKKLNALISQGKK